MRQQTLEAQWADSEAAAAEAAATRRAYLVGALGKCRASSDLRIFVNAVYRHAGGSDRWWKVTVRQLIGAEPAAAQDLDPLGEVMGCSERQAKRVRASARRLGFVRSRPAGSSFRNGDDDWQPGDATEWQIDWDGVRAILGLASETVFPEQPFQNAKSGLETVFTEPSSAMGQGGPSMGQGGPSMGQGGPSMGQGGPKETAQKQYDFAAAYKEDACAGARPPVPVPDRSFLEKKRNRNGTGTGASAPLVLESLTTATLRNTVDLLATLNSLCECSPIPELSTCEADQLWWITAAEYALRTGKSPVGLFRYLVQGNRRSIPKLADEDAARMRLKEVQACRT